MDTMSVAADRLFASFRRDGDPGTLGRLYDLVAPKLLRVALHSTSDAAAAEDAVQATFVTVIERARDFDARQSVLPWMLGILANHVRSARARSSRQPDPVRLGKGATSSPDAEAERAELLERLDRALEELPEAFRPVLVLRVKHGLTAAEIAAALGIPSGTVRSQLARGIEHLRRALPVGLAGGVLASLARPVRGLSGVREAVVAHASLVPTSTLGATALIGALAVKKTLALAAAFAALLVAWRLLPGGAEPHLEDAGTAQTASAAEPLPETTSETAGSVDGAPLAALDAPQVPARIPLADPPPVEVEAAAPSASARPETTGALEVRAQATDGSPVADEIVLVGFPAVPEHDRLSFVGRTDERGLARFEDLPAAHAYARLLRGREDGVLIRAGATTTLTLRVLEGATVEGEVVDGDGRPLAGAEIWVSERFYTNIGHVVATSDAAGRFEISSVGRDHYVGARAQGRSPSALRTVAGRPGERVHLRLVLARPGVLVHGRVVDEHGLGIAGAEILIGNEEPPLAERLDDGLSTFGPPPARATSDQHGEFSVASVPVGRLAFQARAKGHAPGQGELETLEAAEAFLEVRLSSEARVRGRATDAAGVPIAGAWIRTADLNRFAFEGVWSARDGSFELDGLPAGGVRLVADKPGLGRTEETLELRNGETVEWNPAIALSAALHGRVLDQRGAPLHGVIVVATPRPGAAGRPRSEPTDASGVFELHGLEDEPHTVSVHPQGALHEFPLLSRTGVHPSREPLELQVPDPDQASGRIVGTVLGPDGRPVSGAHADLWHESAGLWRSFSVDGTSGALAIERVPEGDVRIEVRHADHPWSKLGTRRIHAGETVDLGELRLGEGGRVRGTLRGLPDELVSGVSVLAGSATGHGESGVVHLRARDYETGPLTQGRHTLVFRGDHVRTHTAAVDVVAGSETIRDVELEACGMRRVVLRSAGEPLPSWVGCSVFDAEGEHAWFGGGPTSEGSVEVRVSVPPGSYELVSRTETGLAAKARLEVTGLDGSDPTLVVELTRE
jgi:RNA polymerase sigma-70 factor (ECF subfamily)